MSRWFLALALISTANCTRRIDTGNNQNQSGVADTCTQVQATLKPLSFTGSNVQQGSEVLWQVHATGCSSGYRMKRADNSAIVSFSERAHFTKRYDNIQNNTQETVLVQAIRADGSFGDEIPVQSDFFSVTASGSGGGNGGGETALTCSAHAAYSNVIAQQNSNGAFHPEAPWVTFTIATNRPTRLVASGSATDTTHFPSGIPSAQNASTHQISGQLQRAGLNAVQFKVIDAANPSLSASCTAPVTVQVTAIPAPPALTCHAYGTPGSVGVAVSTSGHPVSTPRAHIRVDSNRLSLVSSVRTSSGNRPVSPHNQASVSHSGEVELPGLGWNLVEFVLRDASQPTVTAACSANIWVYALVPQGPPTCTLSGPDSLTPGSALSLTLSASGPIFWGQIDGLGPVLPGLGVAVDFPNGTKTYTGRVVGPAGTGICTKTVTVGNPPACSVVASANPVHPGQSITVSVISVGTVNSVTLDVDGQISTLPTSNAVATRTLDQTTVFKGKVTGPTGTGQCQTTVHVDPQTIGVHLEDGSDWDLNDATVCMSGFFKIQGTHIVSTASQTVSASVSRLSACSHNIALRVINPAGVATQSFNFNSASAPAMNLHFAAGSRLDVVYTALGRCSGVGTVGLASAPRVQINNFCRLTGR